MAIIKQSPVKQQFNQNPEKRFTQGGRFNDDLYELLNQFNVKSFRDSLQSFKNSLNSYFFLSGDHKSVSLKEKDFINGVAGATITTKTTFTTKQNKVANIYFSESVTIGPEANIIFDKCSFAKTVTIESGGKAQFIGCIFEQSVNNNGISANVNVIGCMKSSLNSYTNITIIATEDF